VLERSILPLSTTFRLDFGKVPTVWYFLIYNKLSTFNKVEEIMKREKIDYVTIIQRCVLWRGGCENQRQPCGQKLENTKAP